MKGYSPAYESEARRINAAPWDPLPGHRKLQCGLCGFYFASRRRRAWCHDCEERERRALQRAENRAEQREIRRRIEAACPN